MPNFAQFKRVQHMVLIEVNNAQLRTDFHRVPEVIYRNHANYIPHLRQDIDSVFDEKKNRNFHDGEAIRWVVKDFSGALIGRMSAFIAQKYSKGMEQPTGGFGFFECIDDQTVANLLFDAGIGWLKARGMEAVDGPINFGEKDRFWGLLVKNFDDIPSYAMNYNLPYYQQLFENYGFQLYYNQYVYKRDLHVPAQEVFVRKYNAVMADTDYRIANIRGRSWEEVASDFCTVYNNAWGGHHGFKSMPIAQARKIMKALKPIVDRDIVVFVYHKNQPIAFYVNIPELNEIFKHVHGNLNLLGKLKFLYHKLRRTPQIMVGIVFGVDRAYHGKGIEGAMIKWAEDHIVSLNRYHVTTLTWIGDFNPKMMHVAENLGAELSRTFITYRYLFDREKQFERAPIVE
jgi:GNAT superfamily N-acetyltransferase